MKSNRNQILTEVLRERFPRMGLELLGGTLISLEKRLRSATDVSTPAQIRKWARPRVYWAMRDAQRARYADQKMVAGMEHPEHVVDPRRSPDPLAQQEINSAVERNGERVHGVGLSRVRTAGS